jgi:hypothetical protein
VPASVKIHKTQRLCNQQARWNNAIATGNFVATTLMNVSSAKMSSGKLARGPTRPKGSVDAPKREINVSIKQLVPPLQPVEREKNLVTTNLNKPDIHLRPDLLKPTEMYHIHSPKRNSSGNSPNAKTLELDDESNYLEKFNFDEMVRIGRPERDTSLRQPLAKSLQTLRRYKFGTSPSLKAGLLRETLEPIVKDPGTKRMLSKLSPRGRPASPLLYSSGVASHFSEFKQTDIPAEQFLPMTRSTPDLRAISAGEEPERKVVVKQSSDTNLYLYHLSSQGKRSAKVVNMASTKGSVPEGLVTDSIDSSALSAADTNDAEDAAAEVPVMYDPATVRLPRMEIVPGFGSTNPLVESRLGAYHVHSSRAVSTAAALEEASAAEGSRAMSLNSRQGDSYQADRLESFYKSAETSHLHSLDDKSADGGGEGIAQGRATPVGSRSVSSQELSVR